MTLEREIYSIETANINKETLDAMKNASNAMKQIHGGLTIDKVDATMYVFYFVHSRLPSYSSETVVVVVAIASSTALHTAGYFGLSHLRLTRSTAMPRP